MSEKINFKKHFIEKDGVKAGLAKKALAEYHKAIKHLNLALENGLKTYGEDHPHVAKIRKAIELVKKALAECEGSVFTL